MNIIHTSRIPEEGVSHNPEIKKKVFIRKGEIPALMNFSSALFKPGDGVDFHMHETMTEIFYITEGKVLFSTLEKDFEVEAGDVISIAAGEMHKQSNPFDENAGWTYFGIST